MYKAKTNTWYIAGFDSTSWKDISKLFGLEKWNKKWTQGILFLHKVQGSWSCVFPLYTIP